MEQNSNPTPNFQTPAQPKPSFFKSKKFYLVLVILIILIIGLVVSVRLFKFSFPIFPQSQTTQKDLFTCPSITQFCQDGKDILIDGNYIGFGDKLPQQSPIYAIINGELAVNKVTIATSSAGLGKQEMTVATITNRKSSVRAAYYFLGEGIKNKIVRKGETIGSINGKTMPLYNQSSLVFIYTKNDLGMGPRLSGERVKLTKLNFK